jgi:hypothetical protein
MFYKKQVIDEATTRRLRAQDMMPLASISGRAYALKCGDIVMALIVKPKNRSLYSEAETDSEVENTAASFAGQNDDFSIVCLHKPIDASRSLQQIDDAILHYERNLRDDPIGTRADAYRKRSQIARAHFRTEAEYEVYHAEKTERRSYVVVRVAAQVGAVQLCRDKTSIFMHRIEAAGYTCEICDDADLFELAELYLEPSQPVLSLSDAHTIMPLFEGGVHHAA